MAVIIAMGFCGRSATAQIRQAEHNNPNAPADPAHLGEKTFAATCAGCHGLDGQGSEKAPNIAASDKVQRYPDARLSSIISNGVPGTGMPAFRTLSAEKVRAVVGYLRMLQGKRGAQTLPGDALRGKEIFFGKGDCSSCHRMNGEGGFLGPDLSIYGRASSAPAVLDAIVRSDRIVPAGYKSAIVTTRAGDRLEGLIRNEDNFSLQLQAKDGSFHFFDKSDLQNIERLSRSLMPADYGQRLSSGELNDLVNFLIKGGTPPSRREADGETKETEEPH
jgi:putative heme-binding domain-containing protein